MLVARAVGNFVRHCEACALEGVRSHDCGEERGADKLAMPRAVTAMEGTQDPEGPVHAGEEIRNRHPHPGRAIGVGAG